MRFLTCCVLLCASTAHAEDVAEAPNVTRVRREGDANTVHIGGVGLSLMAGRTAEDALRLVPGLVLVQHGNEGKGHQIYLRGFDALHGSDFAVTVEGVRVNEASNVHATGYFDLTLVPGSLVRQVNVDKGPFALAQGLFATAGSADYTLGIDPGERGVRLGYEIGTTWRSRVFASWSPEDANDESFVGVDLVHDAGFGDGRALSRLALAGRFATDVDGDRLTLTAALGVARFELPGLLADEDVDRGYVPFDGAYDVGRGASDRFIGVLRHVHDRGQLRVDTALHIGGRGLFLRENFTGDLVDPVAGDERQQVEQRVHAGIDSTVIAPWGKYFELQLLAGTRWDQIANHEDHVDGDGHVLARNRALETDIVEGTLAVGGRLKLGQVALRLGLHNTLVAREGEVFIAPLPRVSLEWSPRPLTLSMAYGRGARPPEIGATGMTVVDAFEAGGRLRLDGIEATLTGFATLVERESVFDHASGQSLELDGSTRLGVEAGLMVAPWDALTLRVDATIVDARYDRSRHPVPGVARVIVSGEAVLQVDALRVMVRALGVGPRPLAHGATGAGYFDVSLGADYTLGDWRVALAVDNVTNGDAREGVYHFASHWDPATPRSSLPRLAFAAGPPINARLTLSLVL